jgi:SWI/SNF-related matrix-associated actin-dependent regulator of chromatin subfamily A-like protein 1
MRIVDHGTHFHITIERDQWFNRNLAAVKALPAKNWFPEKKVWWVPGLLRSDIEKLTYSHRAQIILPTQVTPEMTGSVAELPELTFEPPIKAELRAYQRKGVARGLELKRYINGDEQGLGKTIQSITTIVAAAMQGEDVFPCLIICPASLKENWKREIEKFSSCKAMILSDKVKTTWPQFFKMDYAQFFIVNYESLKKYFVQTIPGSAKRLHSREILMTPNSELFKAVIIDESHKCKDTTTQQAKLSLRMAHKKQWRILLTGTPVVNKPNDLWSQICIMGHSMLFGGTHRGFKDRYCDGGTGASNLRELNYLLNKHCFFRREKKDVAKDLPSKDRQIILCNLTNRDDYEFAEQNFKMWLQSQNLTAEQVDSALRGEAMVQMQKLKTISARGKMNEVQEFVNEIIESGEKLVLFCNLHEIVDTCLELWPEAVTVTGRDDNQKRQRNIDRFQNDPTCQLIICNIKAAGVGITLTASSRVAFIEYPWTYADCVQCEDRTHRIGQVWPVMCSYFMGHDTIDEYMWEIINAKREVSSIITGATDTMQTSTIDNRNETDKLLNLFKNK